MSYIIEIPIEKCIPDTTEVIKLINSKNDMQIPERIYRLIEGAIQSYLRYAEPKGIIENLSVDEFANVFNGEWNNDAESPLKDVYKKAEHIALFAVTIGGKISEMITEMFEKNQFAHAYMLDTVASCGVDRAAYEIERYFNNFLIQESKINVESMSIRYSPGYCGWHISGQKKLFEKLHPENIRITLNTSYLMSPMKSISGILINGKKEIHIFNKDFSFCSSCKALECQNRILS